VSFPFALPWPGSAPAAPPAYIGRSAGAPSPSIFNWAGPSIDLAATDRLVVGHLREDNGFASSTNSVVCNSVGLTLWPPGQISLVVINRIWLEVYYGTPGAVTGAALVSNTTGCTGVTLFAYKIPGASATPVDAVSSTSATSTSIVLSDIEKKATGAIIAFAAATFGAVTFTESWTGAEPVVEDYEGNSATGNNQLLACHIASASASTTDDLTITLSASKTHIGGAFSMGT
jgi:hypothetical protein